MDNESQEAFAVISQILEFWERDYLSTSDQKITPESLIKDHADVSDNKEELDNKLEPENIPDIDPTKIVGHVIETAGEIAPENTTEPEVAPEETELEVAPEETEPEVAPEEEEPEVAPEETEPEVAPEETAPEIMPENTTEAAPVVPGNITDSAEITQEAVIETKYPAKSVIQKPLKCGHQLNPKLKKDGDWIYYTYHRTSNEFETIFSIPTKVHPVPIATASAWFTINKSNGWEVEFRFGHHHQKHFLVLEKNSEFGLSQRDRDVLKEKMGLIAKPLKRLGEIIEAKSNMGLTIV
jgi:hypothetical protein